MKPYEIYTDGSTLGNGKDAAIGGWAFTIYQGEHKLTYDYGSACATTNQRMELTAILHGLKSWKNLYETEFGSCIIYSDSAYCVNCANQHWYDRWESNGWINSQKQPVKNRDLWEELIPFFRDSRITLIKVKGHDGVELNEEVDKLARGASESLKARLNSENYSN